MSTVETAYDSFNSRAHGGRDPPPRERGRKTTVSIHAPTGGATAQKAQLTYPGRFQFTRPRGARRCGGRGNRSLCRFNSRAHGGRDCASSPLPSQRRGFNSRAHGGRDSPTRRPSRSPHSFQFTRPRGARHPTLQVERTGTTFQFTRPRGARHTQRRATGT